MAALTQERATKTGDLPGFIHVHEPLPVLNATKIYKGALVMIDTTTGEVEEGATATGKRGLGRATKTVDNAADGETLEVEAGAFWWTNSGGDAVDATSIGALCYIEDDQTVAATDGTSTRSPAGVVVDVSADDGVLVLTHPAVFT